MQILLSETAVVYQPNFLTLGEPTNEQNMDNRLGASHTSRIWLLLVRISYIANDGRNTLGQALARSHRNVLGQVLARSHRHIAICWFQEIQILLSEVAVVYQPNFLILGEPTSKPD